MWKKIVAQQFVWKHLGELWNYVQNVEKMSRPHIHRTISAKTRCANSDYVGQWMLLVEEAPNSGGEGWKIWRSLQKILPSLKLTLPSHEPEPWTDTPDRSRKKSFQFSCMFHDLEPSNCLDFWKLWIPLRNKKETSCCHYEESTCRRNPCGRTAGWTFVSPILWSQKFHRSNTLT